MDEIKKSYTDSSPINSLIVVYSYHHHNTAKIAQVLAGVLGAEIKTPDQVISEDLKTYDLIGFGSGIDSGRHYQPILDLVDRLSQVNQQKAFIFSTSAIISTKKVAADHLLLRAKLLGKGFTVIDEFSCKGFNTNSFLKVFGGMNKGRPNEEDVSHAEEFASQLTKKVNSLVAMSL